MKREGISAARRRLRRCARPFRDWGTHLGQGLAQHSPDDFVGLAQDFVQAPDGGKMLQPAVHRCDSSGIDTQMMRCPLKRAWQAAGLPDAEIALLCSVAFEADRGAMEAAGFALDIETWQPGSVGCCLLRIRRR
jgi:hypothetical protein